MAGRHLISAEGRTYRANVIAAVLEQLKKYPKPMLEELAVTIWVCPPDKRKRDLDNLLKAVFDSCTHAGIWKDDSQISDIHILKSASVPGGPWRSPRTLPTGNIPVMSPGSIALEVTPLVS